jgi:hypothetical protein
MHIGIDTVTLKGAGFTPRVKAGDKVEAGARLIEFDIDKLATTARSLLTLVIISNGDAARIVRRASGNVKASDDVLLTLSLVDGAAKSEMPREGAIVISPNLSAEDIDWQDRTIAYSRGKTGATVIIHFGDDLEAVLKTVPKEGPLFPNIRKSREADRATYLKRRCALRDVSGVTLHSYRYAWAERARMAGMPERFAQEALGHNSVAVHRAYAKKAKLKIPSLEEY